MVNNFNIMDYNKIHIKSMLTKKTSSEHYHLFVSYMYQNKKKIVSGFPQLPDKYTLLPGVVI